MEFPKQTSAPVTNLRPRTLAALPARSGVGAYEAHVHDRLRAHHLGDRIAAWSPVEVVEQALATAQEDRHDRHVHLVDELRLEVLADGGHAAADLDVPCPRPP